ncbi:MAG: hypothetical protein II956_12765 [Bacteroidales bacterium]|nr:hypothetical protein [Bacteroidales bacterium]
MQSGSKLLVPFCTSIRGQPKQVAVFLPAAGYCFGTDRNNDGSNGYYWSSTPNGESNAYYLNFNSGNANVNNNNRNYGQSVRAVRCSTYLENLWRIF